MRKFDLQKMYQKLVGKVTKKKLIGTGLLVLPLIVLIPLLLFLHGKQSTVPSIEYDSTAWTLKDGTRMKFVIKKHISPEKSSGTDESTSTSIPTGEEKFVVNLECKYINSEINCDNQLSDEEILLLGNMVAIICPKIGKIKAISCWVVNTEEKIYAVFKVEYLDQKYEEQYIEEEYSFQELGINLESAIDYELLLWQEQEQVIVEGRVILHTLAHIEEIIPFHSMNRTRSPGEVLIAACTTLGTTGFTTDPTNYAAQSFMVNSGYNITSLDVYGKSSPGGAGTLTVQIYSDSSGVPGTQITDGITTTAVSSNKLDWSNFTFATVPSILADTQYWIVISFDNAKKPYSWYYQESFDEYTNGYTAGYDGVSWTSYQATYPNRDCNFKLAGMDITPPVIDTITVTSSNPQYIQLNPDPLNPTGGTCYFNSASGQGAGQILTVTVTWTEIYKANFTGEPAFADTPPADVDGGDGWFVQYSVETGAGNQGNILFTVQDQEGNTDTATIIFENDNTVGVPEFSFKSSQILIFGILIVPIIQTMALIRTPIKED